MNTIREILTQPTPAIVLSADVYFGTGKAFVSGYRVDGGTWVRFSYQERIEVPLSLLDRIFTKYGWTLARPPVKQPSFKMHYFLERSPSTAHSAQEIHAEAQERRRQNEVFEQFRAFEQFQQEIADAH